MEKNVTEGQEQKLEDEAKAPLQLFSSGPDWEASGWDGKKWANSGYVLKVEWIALADGLDIEKRKRKGRIKEDIIIYYLLSGW